MGYKYQFPYIPYVLRAKVTRAGPFSPLPQLPLSVHLRYAYSMVVVCIAIACGTSAVNWYCGIVVVIVCVCGASAVRLRCVCGAPAVRPRYPCCAPAVPLLCVYGVVVFYSSIAVDWLR